MALKVGELFAEFGIDSSALDSALASVSKKCTSMGKSLAKVGAASSVALTAPLTAIGKSIFTAGTNFDAQMSRVGAISGATADEMKSLRTEALRMASQSSFSTLDAATALEYMGMAGWKTEQMIAGLGPIMDLAEASGEDLGSVSDIVTDALTAFGLKAEDAAHFSDVLATASTNSNTNVGMMGNTFKMLAPLAGALGYSIDDVAVAIGLMANSGIKGEMAGTQLRNVLSNLAKPTDEQAAAMKKLGISLTDARGNIRPFSEQLKSWRRAFSGLSDDQKAYYATILAGKEGMSGFLAMVNASESDVAALTSAIENCEGATEQMKKKMLDNAKGDIKMFTSAIDGLEVNLWGLAEAPFRQIVQKATGMVNRFSAMSDTTKLAALKLGTLAAATGPVLTAAGGLLVGVGKLAPALSALAGPAGIVGVGFAAMAIAAVDANNDVGNLLVDMANGGKKQLTKFNRQLTTSFQNISKRLPAITKSMTTALQTILPDAMNSVMLILDGFVVAISNNAQNIAAVGNTIITGLLGGISSALPRLMPAAAVMVTNIATALIKNIPSIIEAGAKLASAIWNGLKNVDWRGLGTQLWTAVKGAFNETGDWIKRSVLGDSYKPDATWSQVGAQLWTNVKNGFKSTGDWIKQQVLGDSYTADATWAQVGAQLWSKVKEGFKATGDWIKLQVLGEGYTADATWSEVGKKIWETIKTGIKDTGDWIKQKILGTEYPVDASWSEVGKKIWEAIKNGVKDTGDWIKLQVLGDGYPADASWGEVGKKIWEAVKKGITAVGDWLGPLVGNAKLQLDDTDWSAIGGKVWDAIKNGITVTGDWLKDLIVGKDFIPDGSSWLAIGEKVIGAILDSKAVKVETITSFLSGLLDSMVSFTGWDTLGQKFGYLGLKIVEGLTSAITSVSDTAVQGINTLGNALGSDGASSLVKGFENFAVTIVDGIADAIPNLADSAINIVTALGTALSKVKWEDISSSLSGIGTSIVGAISTAITKVDDVAASIYNALNTALSNVKWNEIGVDLGNFATSIVDAFASALDGYDVSSVVTALGDCIKTAASGLGSAAGTLVGTLVGYLTDPANLAQLAEVGVQFVKNIASGLYNLGKSTLEGAVGFVVNSLEGLVAGALGIRIDKVAQKAMDEFASMDFDVSPAFGDTGRACGQELIMAMEGALTSRAEINRAAEAWDIMVESGFSKYEPRFAFLGRQGVMELFNGVVDEIESEAPNVEKAAKQVTLLDALGLNDHTNRLFFDDYDIGQAASDMSFGKAVDAEALAAELGYNLGELIGFNMPEGYKLVAKDGMSAIMKTTNGILDENAQLITSGINFESLMSNSWDYLFKNELSDVKRWKNDLITSMESMGITGGQALGAALPEGLKDELLKGNLTIDQAALQILSFNDLIDMDALQQNVTTALQQAETAKETVSSAAADVNTPIETVPDDTLTIAEDTANNMYTPISEAESKVRTASENVAKAFTEPLENVPTDVQTTATTAMTNMKTAIDTNAGPIRTAMSNACSGAVSAVKSVLKVSTASAIGRNFALGIANGISSGISNIASAARRAASAAVTASKTELDIHSPSRVGEKEVGHMWDLGIANGMLRGISAIDNAGRKVASVMHEQMYLSDPGRGQVLSHSQLAQETAQQTAAAARTAGTNATHDRELLATFATMIHTAVSNITIKMDGEKVAETVAPSVSEIIADATTPRRFAPA